MRDDILPVYRAAKLSSKVLENVAAQIPPTFVTVNVSLEADGKNPYPVGRYEGRSRSVQMDTWRARKDLCALPEEDPVSPEEPREAPPRDAEASPLRGYVVVGVWDDPPPDEASRLRRALSWLRTWLRRE